jgi:hypothetical protein
MIGSDVNWRKFDQRGAGREGPTAGSPASRAVGPSLPDRLRDLAHQVQRLSPSHRNPEGFHEDKSEIVAELRRMASGFNR